MKDKKLDLLEYKKALEEVNKYKPTENTEEITGFTKYSGTSKNDKVYPNLFNFIISLLLQIIEKINKLLNKENQIIERLDKLVKNKEARQEVDSDVDKLTKALNNLKISDIKIDKKQQTYKHWIPRK